MGKFSKIRAAALQPGRTVELKLNMLPGEPVLHIEHLGETNGSYWSDVIARANEEIQVEAGGGKRKLTAEGMRDSRARRRKTFADHALRDLEATHDEGPAATKDDIPDFVDALPDDVFELCWDFARNANNFRVIASSPKSIAGK